MVAGETPSGETVSSTALCAAASLGQLETARLLLDGGADPGLADCDGGTPLIHAVTSGCLGVVRLLLERGVALDTTTSRRPGGRTAFHYACAANQPGCAEALARAGCDVGIKDVNGETGRQMAERQGHTVVVDRLRACPGPPGAFKRLSVA